MSDITSIQERFREKAAQTRTNIADMGHLAKEAVQDKLNDLKDRAADKLGDGKAKVQELEESLRHKVQEAPVKSLLIAAGVGIALAFIWRRR